MGVKPKLSDFKARETVSTAGMSSQGNDWNETLRFSKQAKTG